MNTASLKRSQRLDSLNKGCGKQIGGLFEELGDGS
jgi:hypothetical protein